MVPPMEECTLMVLSCCLQVMVTAGPWHARLLAQGSQRIEELEAAFFEGQALDQPVAHHPRARLLVMRRPKAAL